MLIMISHSSLYGFVSYFLLTQWGRVTQICVGNLTIIGSDNGLSPGRRQSIIWTNAGILLKVEYLIICIICDTDLVNKLILQMYTLHKYK